MMAFYKGMLGGFALIWILEFVTGFHGLQNGWMWVQLALECSGAYYLGRYHEKHVLARSAQE